jgi:hypothetical protein
MKRGRNALKKSRKQMMCVKYGEYGSYSSLRKQKGARKGFSTNTTPVSIEEATNIFNLCMYVAKRGIVFNRKPDLFSGRELTFEQTFQ